VRPHSSRAPAARSASPLSSITGHAPAYRDSDSRPLFVLLATVEARDRAGAAEMPYRWLLPVPTIAGRWMERILPLESEAVEGVARVARVELLRDRAGGEVHDGDGLGAGGQEGGLGPIGAERDGVGAAGELDLPPGGRERLIGGHDHRAVGLAADAGGVRGHGPRGDCGHRGDQGGSRAEAGESAPARALPAGELSDRDVAGDRRRGAIFSA